MTQHDQPILARDPVTGDYIADFRICIPAEFYRRAFYTYCEEENIDLTSLEALAAVMARVGAVGKWLTHPQKKITAIQVTRPEVKQPAAAIAEEHHISKSRTRLLYDELREQAQHTAPHLWEEVCQTPTPSLQMPSQTGEVWEAFCQWLERRSLTPAMLTAEELAYQWKQYRTDIGRLRYDERKILKELHEEWQRGDLTLDPEVAEQERRYQETQQKNLTMKIETIADAVNGSRIL